MAIPQPGFVGTRQGYRDTQEQKAGRVAGQIGQFANVMQGNRQLAEEQRQYDVKNQLVMADSIRRNQYDGDWAQYIKEDPTAPGVFASIYGPEKGAQVYEQAKTGTAQTRGQIFENIRKQYFIEGAPGQSEGGQPPAGGAVGQTPVSSRGQAQPPQQGSGTASRPLDPRLGTPTVQQQLTTPTLGASLPQEQAGTMQAPNVSPRSGAPSQKVEVEGGAVDRDQNAQYTSDYGAAAGAQGEAQPLTNERGMVAAEGQEKASLPVNTQTIEQVWGSVQVPPDSDVSSIASSIGKAAEGSGASGEAVSFLKQGTAHLRGASEEQWAEYDKRAQEHFGVDGETLFAIRNQMFDNAQKGRPLGYMPPEGERDQWWWTGKDMPIPAAAREVVADPEPDESTMAKVAGDATQLDFASLSPEELRNMSEFTEKVRSRTIESMVDEPKFSKFYAKAAGVGESTGPTVQAAAKAVHGAENSGQLNKHMDENPKQEKLFTRMLDSLSSTLSTGTRKQVGDHRFIEKAASKKEEGKELSFKERIGVSRKRYETIVGELESGQLSREVEMTMPMEERQFEEAQSQFAQNMALQRDQLPSEELRKREMKLKEKQLDLQAAELALSELELGMAKDELEARLNGEAPPDLTLAYEASNETYNLYMKGIIEKSEGNAEEMSRQINYLLKNNEQFKAAHDNRARIISAMSGVPIEEVTAQLTKDPGWLAEFWQKRAGTYVGETSFTTLNTGGAPAQVETTVKSGGGGEGQSDADAVAAKHGY